MIPTSKIKSWTQIPRESEMEPVNVGKNATISSIGIYTDTIIHKNIKFKIGSDSLKPKHFTINAFTLEWRFRP